MPHFPLLRSLFHTCRWSAIIGERVRFTQVKKKKIWRAPLHAPSPPKRLENERQSNCSKATRSLDSVVISCLCPPSEHLQRKTLCQAIVLLVESAERSLLLEQRGQEIADRRRRRRRKYRASSDRERLVSKRKISILFYYIRQVLSGIFPPVFHRRVVLIH